MSRAFLRALVQLIGNYRDALRFQQGEKITFNADAFVESRPPQLQPFVRKMLELQIFQQVSQLLIQHTIRTQIRRMIDVSQSGQINYDFIHIHKLLLFFPISVKKQLQEYFPLTKHL